MSLAMTPAEREAFLAEAHVAVVTVADGDRGPLAIPLWYDYRPGGEIVLVTDRDSRKARLIRGAGRVTVCAQLQEPPYYRYASVEGPVTAIADTVTIEQRRALAHRYLSHEDAERYLEDTRDATGRMCAIHVRPERWLTRDYRKSGR